MNRVLGLAAVAWLGGVTSSFAQQAVIQVPSARAQASATPAQAATTAPAPAPAPAAVAAAPAAPPAHARLHIPEGTEARIRIDDKLSSANNVDGDTFSITLVEPMAIDGSTIPAGYRGKGEVVQAKRKGMMGQGGELNIKLDYLRVGDARIRLRGQKGGEGDGAMASTVALTVLFGPLGLLKHGHDMTINKGQELTAYVDQDTTLDDSLPKPPPED
jgi:hypothetical protein